MIDGAITPGNPKPVTLSFLYLLIAEDTLRAKLFSHLFEFYLIAMPTLTLVIPIHRSVQNKDAGVCKEKKRGPKTKENKAKKKGDKCKFSHDTIPLTKSKMPLTEGSPSTANASKPELKFSSLLRGTNSEKQLNLNNSSHQKADSSKNTKQDVVETILKRAVQTQPKGISKLMFGKLALDNPSKLNQVRSSPITGVGGVKVGLPTIRGTPDMAQNSNEITKMTAAVESKGINFLSFGKAPLKDCGIPKSTSFGDSNKDKQAASSPKKDVGLKIGNQTGQITRDVIAVATHIHVVVMLMFTCTTCVAKFASLNLVLLCVYVIRLSVARMLCSFLDVKPRVEREALEEGEEFLRGDRFPSLIPRDRTDLDLFLDPNVPRAKVSVPLDQPKDNDVVSSVQERETAPKRQIPSSKPWKQLSSSLPSDQSVDQLTDEHGKDTPSSALKALWSNMPNAAQKERLSNMTYSAQKALMSTLAFAAKYESRIKMDCPPDVSSNFNKESSSSQNTSRGSTILDFLYGSGTMEIILSYQILKGSKFILLVASMMSRMLQQKKSMMPLSKAQIRII
ncbi:hypothetical protein HYC85_016892 [Camellia sinensis]|uniref:Uncharacterized protein n=1 Tax=Camellia sinensis TaxID=4442 RepID=A0A7J7H4A8_CAMSI|nr:hypothetical protein HYC85_016892 [Camellia sinensis]